MKKSVVVVMQTLVAGMSAITIIQKGESLVQECLCILSRSLDEPCPTRRRIVEININFLSRCASRRQCGTVLTANVAALDFQLPNNRSAHCVCKRSQGDPRQR